VAIAGWGLRTPLGAEVGAIVERLLAGERAARPNPRFDASTYACTLAAPVEVEPAPSRHGRFVKRMGLLGMEVAAEAMRHAGGAGGERVGLFSAVGGLRAHWNDLLPALERQLPDGSDTWERGFKGTHPFWMLQHLSNNAHALAAAELRLRGEGATFGGATAGAQAMAAAGRAIEDGAVTAALVVAYDSLLEPETLVELGARGDATGAGLESLAAPYGAGACGGVPGEAAAALWLVDAGRAAAGRAGAGAGRVETGRAGTGRAGAGRAETGRAGTGRAETGTMALVEARAVADGGRGAAAGETLGRAAAAIAGGAPVEVVDGAAQAWPALDAAERVAVGAVVGEERVLVATAAALGMMGAATSVVQAIVLAELLRRGELPAIAGLKVPAAGPLRPLVARERTAARVALGMSGGAPGLAAAVRVEIPGGGGQR
jgi:3-oxoacyl-(acyl-carrier-protein) synthase